VHEVVFNQRHNEIPEVVERVHRSMRKDCSVLPTDDEASYGAGTKTHSSDTQSISSIVKKSSVNRKYGALLYRITRWFNPDMILELGTGLGISGMYLSAGNPETALHTVEGSRIRTVISKQVFKRCKLSNVKIHCGELDEELEGLLRELPGRYVAFVDANHRYGPTVGYVRSILAKAGDEAIIILDDIYWSKGMNKAWKEIIEWTEVHVSIDLFYMGIILLRKDIHKARMKIKF